MKDMCNSCCIRHNGSTVKQFNSVFFMLFKEKKMFAERKKWEGQAFLSPFMLCACNDYVYTRQVA